MLWRNKPYACPVCSWQGMRAIAPDQDAICPECGSDLALRTWLDTWGLTLLILGVVVGVVLFVAYFGTEW